MTVTANFKTPQVMTCCLLREVLVILYISVLIFQIFVSLIEPKSQTRIAFLQCTIS